jgi:flagellar M-ring protein FliF
MALIEPGKTMERFSEVSRLPAVRQFALLLGLAASIALGVGVVFWAQEPTYSPLYGNLTEMDSSQVITQLEQSNLTYRYDAGSGVISVPADDIHQARILLASAGLPRSTERGFDVLYDDQAIGTSAFMESARYNRALEEELALSISAIESVNGARVHLAIPKQSAFIRNRTKPNASVVVNLHQGRNLSEPQVAGIIYLVASSVADLEPESVTLIDQKGRLLSSRSSSEELMLSSEQFRFSRQIEDSYMQRVTDLLIPVLGLDNFRVQVTASIDHTAEERTVEQFGQQPAAIRSEQTMQESSGTADAAGGIPGALTEVPVEPVAPGQEAAAGPAVAPGQKTTLRETRNFELDRTIRHIKETGGIVERLSVAVVLNNRTQLAEDGVTFESVALPPEEITRIENLVKEAVGFSDVRGDTVIVTNTAFFVPEEIILEPLSFLEGNPWIWDAGKMLGGFVAILLLIFMVLRPVLRSVAEAASSSARMINPQLAVPGGEMPQGYDGQPLAIGADGTYPAGALAAASQQTYEQQVRQARNMVQEDPARVAQVLKTWVATDG